MRLTRSDALIAALLGVFATALLAWVMPVEPVGQYHDDAIYLTSAQALAEGRGYVVDTLPGSPPQTKYPPLYSILLALVWKVAPDFPGNVPAMAWVTRAFAGLAAALGYLALRRLRDGQDSPDRLICLTAVLASVVSVRASHFFGLLLPDGLYAAQLMLAAFAMNGLLAEPDGKRPLRIFLLGLALGLPALNRPLGLAVPLAAGFVWLARPERLARLKILWPAFVSAALPGLGWLIWARIQKAGVPEAVSRYYLGYGDWWADLTPWAMAKVALWNTIFSLWGFSYYLLNLDFSTWLSKQFHPGLVLAGLLLLAVPLLLGFARDLRRPLPAILAAHLAILLVWPWPPMRYLLAFVPLYVAWLLEPVGRTIARRLPTRASRAVMAAICVVVLLPNLLVLPEIAGLRRSAWSATAALVPIDRPGALLAEPEDYRAAIRAVSERMAPDEPLACGLDTLVALYADRKALRPFSVNPLAMVYQLPGQPLGSLDAMLEAMRAVGARRLLRLPMPGFQEEAPLDELIAEAQRREPPVFRIVWQGEYGDGAEFVLYELIQP